ncbi:MAG: SDR family oxidoreductase [Zoogloeaceae bacterium]|jgi:3-oxoacyl-[acyl-carrier protein] reductase|nr:SDR family oxidoreductase [Zoogloeaceae bacterium]
MSNGTTSETPKAAKASVALVTGAAQGLGFAIASRLLAAGFKVALTGRELEGVEAAAAALDPDGENTLALKLDVTVRQDFVTALAAVEARLGTLTAVVNNAAVTRMTPVLEITEAEFNEVVTTNLTSVLTSCQVLGKHMADRGYGRIVNLASLAGQNGGTATGAHYAASKGGIITLTKIFAKEFGPCGVTVNAIAPGPTDSPLVRGMSEEKTQQVLANIPVRQFGSPDFLGDLVVLLTSPEAAFATGATWDVNGGLYMR